MTKINFNAKLLIDGAPSIGEKLKITSIDITSVKSDGTLKIETTPQNNAKWVLKTTKDNYNINYNNGLKNIYLTDNYQTISSEEQSLLLMPQTFNSNGLSKLIINYGIYNELDELVGEEKKTEHYIHNLTSNFPIGKAINFNIQ